MNITGQYLASSSPSTPNTLNTSTSTDEEDIGTPPRSVPSFSLQPTDYHFAYVTCNSFQAINDEYCSSPDASLALPNFTCPSSPMMRQESSVELESSTNVKTVLQTPAFSSTLYFDCPRVSCKSPSVVYLGDDLECMNPACNKLFLSDFDDEDDEYDSELCQRNKSSPPSLRMRGSIHPLW